MERLVSNRLKSLRQEKMKYHMRLNTINPNFEFSGMDDFFHVKLTKEKFTANDKVVITNKEEGISLSSHLGDSEYIYLFMNDKGELKRLTDLFRQKSGRRIDLSLSGFCDKTISTEFFFIFILAIGERINIKITPGRNMAFTVPDMEKVELLKIAVRVKGNGFSHLQNPVLYSQDVQTFQMARVLKIKEPKRIKDMKVVFIGDEFTTRSFEPEFHLIKVTPDHWEEELSETEPDLFFCESAWLGNNGSWKNRVGTGGPRDHTSLLRLLDWCKQNRIPSVFWNKEDPFHYNAFIGTAKHFDYVFTTDAGSIEKYLQDNCKQVFTFPFAAQPKYHNPIEKYERIQKVVFAGAYYGEKFPERKQVMDHMIEISGHYGLEIFDRNFGKPESPNQFPEKFKSFIAGTLKGDEIEKAYKGYRVALNVNSIIDSPTMFSRRVFEIIASNTPVVSSESIGIKNLFGDILLASNNFATLQERIKKYFEDEEFYKKNRLLGLRKVLEEHTYTHRIKMMLGQIGIGYTEDDHVVTVVGLVRSEEDYTLLLEQFNRQEWKKKKLLILLDIFEGYLDIFNSNNHGYAGTYLIDYIHHYDSLDAIIDTGYFAVFDQRNYYGDYYLTDLMLATLYVQDAIIVKGADEEYTFTTGGQIGRALLRKKSTGLLKPIDLVKRISAPETPSLNDWFKYGARFFAIDGFNVIEHSAADLAGKIKELTI